MQLREGDRLGRFVFQTAECRNGGIGQACGIEVAGEYHHAAVGACVERAVECRYAVEVEALHVAESGGFDIVDSCVCAVGGEHVAHKPVHAGHELTVGGAVEHLFKHRFVVVVEIFDHRLLYLVEVVVTQFGIGDFLIYEIEKLSGLVGCE